MYRTPVVKAIRLLLLIMILTGCSQKPILIGFSGEMTGPRGEMGVAGRDAAQLAVDTINANGGIHGIPLRLIAIDDQGSADIAKQVDKELIDQGVVAIIGHMTSEQTAVAYDQANQAGYVLLSPTSSSNIFSQKEDFFFRVMPDNDVFGRALATHAYQNRGIRQIVGIYDLNNRSFTETYWNAMKDQFEQMGGTASQSYAFYSGETDLKALMTQVKASDPEAILFIASAVDTALMAQYARINGIEAKLFASSWAQTTELIEKGGRAVQGMEISATIHPNNPYPEYTEFATQFEERYRRTPGLGAAHSYEAVLVLAEALKSTGGKAHGLPEALTKIQGLNGVQGVLSLDKYGDVERETYIVVVQNGGFYILETIPPDAFTLPAAP